MVVPPSTGGNPPQPNPAAPKPPTARPNGIGPVGPHNPYLSARRAAPLDMNTVERRGLQNREPPRRNRPHGLQEAPVYKPTEDEFKDPMAYMRKIAPEASKFGICKIIPPDSWNPEFAIDLERFHFRTRRQELNSVEGGTRANLNYLDQLAKFHKQFGSNLNRFPSVDKRPLDLYKLKKAVEIRGGFEKVCKLKKWAEIGRDLGYSGKIMSSLSTSLKNSYQRWLHPYEEYLRTAKPGVHQQLEFEHGGPFSPSPANSPMRRQASQQNTPMSMGENSPAGHASTALNASLAPIDNPQTLNTSLGPMENSARSSAPPMPPLEAPRPISSSEFMPVNSGFAAVNAPSSSGFTAVNNTPQTFIKRENDFSHNTPQPLAEPLNLSAKNTPGFTPTNGHSPLTNITNGVGPNPMKRALSHESTNGDSQSDGGMNGDDGSGRRSKRVKKDGVPTVAGSQMNLMRPSTPRNRSKSAKRRNGDKCETCSKTEDRESILVCESCDNGYHKYCLDPPLQDMPDYDWHCPRCLVGTGEYGFEEGGIYSLRQFQEKANNFKENYFGPRMPFDPVLNTQKKVTEDEVEREFWRLVESLTETVEVEYGADIHSTTHGSGFPTVEKNPLNPYSKDAWNLNVLPFHEESLFRHIKTDISGMTVPWLYVGMCFSTFCWHNEDHYAYSANYQHFGSTKTWYGIPGSDAHAFEAAMRQAVPELFETQPDLLFQLVTLLPPDQLRKAGVNVYALDQRAGQMVVTFPQAYHAGFNHGFNFNEAVNFAPADWEPFGQTGVQRLQEFRRQPCFSHDELLLTAAATDSTIKTAKWLAPALERMQVREIRDREAFLVKHKESLPHDCKIDSGGNDGEDAGQCALKFVVEDEDLPEDEYQCHYCKAYTYLSQFQCHATSKVACLSHVDMVDCCAEALPSKLLGPNHTLRFRYTNDGLSTVIQKTLDKARIPEAWQEKLDNLLEDQPKPSLKALHTVLTEGEKIPAFLPGLKDLTVFVRRCDKWVEEANTYVIRKQQNRRKNERVWRKSSLKDTKIEENITETRTPGKMALLLREADNLGFESPVYDQLQTRMEEITDWQARARLLHTHAHVHTVGELEETLEVAKSFNVDQLREAEDLEQTLSRMKWSQEAKQFREAASSQTLQQCKDFLERARTLGIPPNNTDILHFSELCRQGDLWETKATEVMSAETVHYPQLESLHNQVSGVNHFPVNPTTLSQMDAILTKNRDLHRSILSIYERCKDPEFRRRPLYKEVKEMMDSMAEHNSKPQGAMDLEREQRRHEDWMRKGKKLFGKANAPLHILKVHMQYVEDKNNYCFDLNDTFRPPVEPSSRASSPARDPARDGLGRGTLGEDEKAIFCICRMPEAGMMIECEVCHDWYHGKCLKIARGKVKQDDTFTCPICDWRVKIPRDAARPKLEELLDWQGEILQLPFQPEEEDVLDRIIDKAQAFRDFLSQYTNGNNICRTSEEMPTLLFYLRKIEGAEVLLSFETNMFRQELHKWQPIAPEAPPIIDSSGSTRKPRPTKQQKLMAQMGITDPDELPPHLRTKHHSAKRKSTDPHVRPPPPLQPAQQGRSNTPQGPVRQSSTGNAPQSAHSATNGFDSPFSNAYTSSHHRSGSPPLFSPTSTVAPLRDPIMGAATTNGSLDSGLSGMFSPGFRMSADDDIRTGLAGTSSSNHGAAGMPSDHGLVSSPHHHEGVDDMFAEMTHHDVEDSMRDENPAGVSGGPEPDTSGLAAAALEHEASQASEALDALKSAGEDGDERGGDGGMDEFLNA